MWDPTERRPSDSVESAQICPTQTRPPGSRCRRRFCHCLLGPSGCVPIALPLSESHNHSVPKDLQGPPSIPLCPLTASLSSTSLHGSGTPGGSVTPNSLCQHPTIPLKKLFLIPNRTFPAQGEADPTCVPVTGCSQLLSAQNAVRISARTQLWAQCSAFGAAGVSGAAQDGAPGLLRQ